MADMGFGLSRQEVMRLAFQIADKSRIKHPFKNGAASRKMFAAFQSRHPNLTLRKPKSLFYVRAKPVNPGLFLQSCKVRCTVRTLQSPY